MSPLLCRDNKSRTSAFQKHQKTKNYNEKEKLIEYAKYKFSFVKKL